MVKRFSEDSVSKFGGDANSTGEMGPKDERSKDVFGFVLGGAEN